MTEAKEVLRELAHAIRTCRYDGDEEGAVADALKKADAILNEHIPDGWTTWNGAGDCPTNPKTRVEVKLRDGTTCSTYAYLLWWGWKDSPLDIVAFQEEKSAGNALPPCGEPSRKWSTPKMSAIHPGDPFYDEQPSAATRITLGPIKPEPSALDQQVAGDHYKKLKIQPIEFIHANGIPFAEGSVIKYVTRWRDKGGIKDLEKAKHFIELLIEMEAKK